MRRRLSLTTARRLQRRYEAMAMRLEGDTREFCQTEGYNLLALLTARKSLANACALLAAWIERLEEEKKR